MLLLHSNMPRIMISLINRIPKRILNGDTPYKRLYHVEPTYDLVHVFGYQAHVLLPKSQRSFRKVASKTDMMVYLGPDPSATKCGILELAGWFELAKSTLTIHSGLLDNVQDVVSLDLPFGVVPFSSKSMLSPEENSPVGGTNVYIIATVPIPSTPPQLAPSLEPQQPQLPLTPSMPIRTSSRERKPKEIWTEKSPLHLVDKNRLRWKHERKRSFKGMRQGPATIQRQCTKLSLARSNGVVRGDELRMGEAPSYGNGRNV